MVRFQPPLICTCNTGRIYKATYWLFLFPRCADNKLERKRVDIVVCLLNFLHYHTIEEEDEEEEKMKDCHRKKLLFVLVSVETIFRLFAIVLTINIPPALFLSMHFSYQTPTTGCRN
jgi:hypothetical protein